MASSASFKWNTARLAQVRQKFGQGLLKMGYDIAEKARKNAPHDSGNLIRSIRVDAAESSPERVIVKAGGNMGGFSVPYARRREYENNLHPGTKYYMHRAFDTVVRGDIAKYFKGVTK